MLGKKSLVVLAVVGLTCGGLGCQKLESDQPVVGANPLPVQAIGSLGSIPVEYGELVAVTHNPESARFAWLWFEQPDKTIIVVSVDFERRQIQENVTIIPRS